MYYLQSRYYDSKICRFINADSALYHSMLGYNMFAYCGNNPVNRYDSTGKYYEDFWNNYGDPLDYWLLEGAGAGGYGATGNYFGYGTSYYNYSVYSKTAVYDSYLGGYYYGGGGYVGGYTAQFAVGFVSVTDSMVTDNSSGKGFYTFKDLKEYLGSAGENNHWHHLVEQCQIEKSGFSPLQVHNTNNIVSVDSTIHSKISGYYSSKPPFTNGLTVRNWLAGQPYQVQFNFGVEIYLKYTR